MSKVLSATSLFLKRGLFASTGRHGGLTAPVGEIASTIFARSEPCADSMTSTFDIDSQGKGDSKYQYVLYLSDASATLAARMPTYVTLKEVKRRWGHGQEDVFPVAQFEKLWGDMSALPEVNCGFVAVLRYRGQQLKEQAQLDGWLRDGSAAFVESLCAWE